MFKILFYMVSWVMLVVVETFSALATSLAALNLFNYILETLRSKKA